MEHSRRLCVRGLAATMAAAVEVLVCAGAEGQVRISLRPNAELHVSGTPGSDRIVVAPFGALVLVVARDGQGAVVRRAVFRGSVRTVSVRGGDGDDLILNLTKLMGDLRGDAGNDDIVGGADWDEIAGGRGADIAVERAGVNTLDGGDGPDILVGGTSFDWIKGQWSPDLLVGRSGSTLMHGGDGNDVLLGGSDVDDEYGQDGHDVLFGLGGADGLSGENGDDLLCGGDGDDLLAGGPGDDALYGETGADDHDGGLGTNDVYVDPLVGDTFVNGRQRPELPCAERGEPVAVTELPAGALLAQSEGQLVVMGTPGADAIRIEADRDTVRVTVDGRAKTVEWAQGRSGARIYVDAAEGDDRVQVGGRVEALLIEGGAGNDEIDAQGAEGPAAILLGGAGDDVLRAGRGGTILAGEDGDDVLVPAGPSDLVSTGTGRDQVQGDRGLATIVERPRPTGRELLEPPAASAHTPPR